MVFDALINFFYLEFKSEILCPGIFVSFGDWVVIELSRFFEVFGVLINRLDCWFAMMIYTQHLGGLGSTPKKNCSSVFPNGKFFGELNIS
jgi:hypothetical protein